MNVPFCQFIATTLTVFKYNVIKVKTLSNFFYSRGVWNSPFITSIYLIQKQVLNEMQGSFGPSKLDPDMALCQYFRDRVSISMWCPWRYWLDLAPLHLISNPPFLILVQTSNVEPIGKGLMAKVWLWFRHQT